MPIDTVILQAETSYEVRAVLSASLVFNQQRPLRVLRSKKDELHAWADLLSEGKAMPVGSVEFVHQAFTVIGRQAPSFDCYPQPLRKYLRRDVRRVPAGHVLGTWFVKPVATKLFDGFVFETLQERHSMDPHTLVQYESFMAMRPDEHVWISEVVSFASEHRYYIQNGAILGSARYDQHPDENRPVPDRSLVLEMVSAMGCLDTYALDVGVLASGETVLVEVNDAYGIGLYPGALTPLEYLGFLSERWETLWVKKDAIAHQRQDAVTVA